MNWILVLYTLAPSHWGLYPSGLDTIQTKTKQACFVILETIRDKEPQVQGFCLKK